MEFTKYSGVTCFSSSTEQSYLSWWSNIWDVDLRSQGRGSSPGRVAIKWLLLGRVTVGGQVGIHHLGI